MPRPHIIFIFTFFAFLFVTACKQADYCNHSRESRYEDDARQNDVAKFDNCGNTYRFDNEQIKYKIVDKSSLSDRVDQETYRDTIENLNISIADLDSQLSQLELGISIVQSTGDADITVNLVDELKSDDDRGVFSMSISPYQSYECSIYADCEWYVSNMKIEIEMLNGAKITDDYDLEFILKHEVLHSLGIFGHSESVYDIMTNDSSGRYNSQLSDRDKRTLQHVYSKEIDIPINL